MSGGHWTSAADYFAPRDYLEGDLGKGVLRARGGERLIAFPHELCLGLLSGLIDECGEAWQVVMQRCGELWGKRHMERTERGLGAFHGGSLREAPLAFVHAALESSWATHGWGKLSLDATGLEAGLLAATVEGSPWANVFLASGRDPKGKPVCGLLSGVLSGMFTHASGADISGHEIACSARGEPACRFVLGRGPKLAEVQEWVRAGVSADEIVARLRGEPGGRRA